MISGTLAEVIAAINFRLYWKTSEQLAGFHDKLEATQRYLLANSICELLDGQNKQAARVELVRAIARINLQDAPLKAFAAAEKG